MTYPEVPNSLTTNKKGEPVAPKHQEATLSSNRKKLIKNMGKTTINPSLN